MYNTTDEMVEFSRKGRSARQRIGDWKRAQKLRGRKSRPKSYLRTAVDGAIGAIAVDSVLYGASVYGAEKKAGLSNKAAILSAKNVAMSRLRPHNLVGTAARGAFQNVTTRATVDAILRKQGRKRGRFSGETKNIIIFKKSRTARQRAGDLVRALKLRGRKRKGISGKTAAAIIGGGAALGLGAAYTEIKLKESPVARELIRVGLSAKDKYYRYNEHSPIQVRTEYDDHHGLLQRGKSAYLTARDVNKSRIESAKIAWKTMEKQLERGKKNNPSKSDLLERIDQLKRQQRRQQRRQKK